MRLDALLVENGLAPTRAKAQAMIMAGSVLVEGDVADKPGKEVKAGSAVTVKEGLPFVSRGGVKLAGGLDGFGIDPAGQVIMDVGSSTGGFTDCLLKRGAAHVYAVDVGRGVMDYALSKDGRVTLLEGRNIRYMEAAQIGRLVDGAVIDVSFISLEKVLPKVKSLVKPGGFILALVKPQFEVGKGEVGKGGIVKDPGQHRAVVERIAAFSVSIGLAPGGAIESPITGAKGNREFWMCLKN
ncbi:MAG: TlyA family RNA methyltransferase [Deltaproteobacteria bacterium]|nr:TlyA family RNA methyltransferase [Deltaproteobacteria bacterium]